MAVGAVAAGTASAQTAASTSPRGQSAGPATVTVTGTAMRVETSTLTAVIDKGFITSLTSRETGEEFIEGVEVNRTAALRLLYLNDETVGIDESKFGSITAHQLSPNRAEFVFHGWDGDGVLSVGADPENGDLVLEPSAYSSRPGVRACRWCLKGIKPGLRLVAPFFQGVNLALDDSLIQDTRWEWPIWWEAGFAVFQSRDGGMWVHTRDDRYRYKALKIGLDGETRAAGFDSEAYGPADNNLSAGGIAWRINVHRGDWRVPAGHYRDWYVKAYDIDTAERTRRPWIHDIRFAVSWCPGSPDILDALAKRLEPRKVLIHYPDWRTDPYDENYPTYIASEKGRGFIAKARSMGFRIMPHFNSIDMDPSHPVYAQIRDFQYRSLEKRQLQGWSWYQGRGIGVPESNMNRTGNRDKKVMVKVHPGLSMWRSILGRNILDAVREHVLETVFIDVTLHSMNLHNSLVESTTSTEGMKRLIEHVASLGEGLAVGGEGRNEITAQGQSFAQAHLFKSWQTSIKDLERTGGCDVNEFLFGKLCRTIGYSGLGGRNPDEELRMRIHLEHGAMPTVTISSAKDITEPNPAVKRMLDIAAG
jgi:hypothetical protein